MANPIKMPFPVFFDTDGSPLEGGYVYTGVSGLNPLSNPLTVYWDQALTIPAANIRTQGGFIAYNGAPGQLYTAGDYSILVQDKNGKTLYSRLTSTVEYSDYFLTTQRGTLTRSMRTPPSYDPNLIRESGHYAWTNAATVHLPTGCAAADLFELDAFASPDGSGIITQRLYDLTNGPASAYYVFHRQSTDGGSTWTAWYRLKSATLKGVASGYVISSETKDDFYSLYGEAADATITLPALSSVPLGTKYTFKKRSTGAFKWTVTCAGADTIGSTGSTSFVLYARDDYVVLQSDGDYWQVVGTNGPLLTALQTSGGALGTSGAWAALGGGLSLSLGPGVYDFEMQVTHTSPLTPFQRKLAIGNSLTPLHSNSASVLSSGGGTMVGEYVCAKGCILAAAATVQGIYYQATTGGSGLIYDATYSIGYIRARRIG